MFARSIVRFSQTALQGRIEDALDETGLTGTRHASNYSHHVEGNLYVNAPEVVHTCSFDDDMMVPGAARRWHGDLVHMQQIPDRMAPWPPVSNVLNSLQLLVSLSSYYIVRISFEDHLPAQTSSVGAYVDEVVCGTHNLLVVLHYDHSVTQRLQFLQYMDKSYGVAAMETDARLIEDIKRPYQ